MKKILAIAAMQLGLVTSAFASFDIVYDVAHLDQATGQTTFHFEFSEPVDLTTVDEAGWAARQFQVFVYGDESLDYPDKFSAIIRTAESPETGNNVVVRAASPQNDAEASDPLSGGWGRVLAVAPLTVSGNGVTFTLSNASFNSFGNNVFKYDLMTVEYGGMGSFSPGRMATLAPVPEIGTATQLLLGGGLVFGLAGSRRVAARRGMAQSTI